MYIHEVGKGPAELLWEMEEEFGALKKGDQEQRNKGMWETNKIRKGKKISGS